MNRSVKKYQYKKNKILIPEFLNNKRYIPLKILSVGGMGIIIIAKDTTLFNKKVLIKRPVYKKSIFNYKNDKNREKEIQKLREIFEKEKVIIYHALAREVANIPLLLDSFSDFNPDLYGPFTDKNGETFYGEQELYEKEIHLVLNYYNGLPASYNHYFFKKNREGAVRYFIKRVGKILERFHTPYILGSDAYRFFYCDLKPSNIIITRENNIILIDMGSFAIEKNKKIVRSGSITPGYSAPELFKKLNSESPLADVYSLGVCAYELLTGKKPEGSAKDTPQFDFDIIKKDFPKWTHFFEKSLAYLPEDRFSSIPEMLSEIPGYKNKNPYNYYNKLYLNNILPEKTYKYSFIKKIEYYDKCHATSKLICKKIKYCYDFYNKDNIINEFAKRVYSNKIQLLTKNFNFVPELVEIKNDEYYCIEPSLFNNFDNIQLNDFLKKLYYLFNTLYKHNIAMIGISPTSIKIKKLDYSFFISDITVLFFKNDKNLNNPLLHKIFNKKFYIIPPEIIDKKFNYWEKTFSFLCGYFLLFKIFPNRDLLFSESFQLQDYHREITSLKIDNYLKTLILKSISPDPNQRASLYDLINEIKQLDTGILKKFKNLLKIFKI